MGKLSQEVGLMSDVLSKLGSVYSSEAIEEEIKFIRECNFVREPENKGVPVGSLYKALDSLAKKYERTSH
jgi:hypothetical protein